MVLHNVKCFFALSEFIRRDCVWVIGWFFFFKCFGRTCGWVLTVKWYYEALRLCIEFLSCGKCPLTFTQGPYIRSVLTSTQIQGYCSNLQQMMQWTGLCCATLTECCQTNCSWPITHKQLQPDRERLSFSRNFKNQTSADSDTGADISCMPHNNKDLTCRSSCW